ncbi:HNH endonuclease [Pullulanibacillus sp. KACC 23026]|uniref:HNH endonuclease n=1 Tax=Pullulanibacillus sp. KACC 23026 TaxID=3028315 RepID=UPI0023AF9FAA|nr:HNH endonuclease [Pullulanibacillus sp. KACC 23026]WEG13993.1 HNH endonuclease [Pullulanibacillus sp. KACC 23026]
MDNRKRERNSQADTLRNTKAWRKKSKEIRKRDKGLCQICIRNLYHTTNQYTFDTIEVHHIIPLSEGGSLLSNHNLISLCKFHHNLSEAGGEISRATQLKIAREQEEKNSLSV